MGETATKSRGGRLDDAEIMAAAGELRALIGKLRRTLQEQSTPGDFTPSQVAALARLLNGGPATLTALAHAEGMRPQSMSAIVAVLETAGFVTGTADPSDGRQTILSLTDRARETIYAGRAAKDDWLFRVIRSRLADDEQAQLAGSIQLLKRLIEPEKESSIA
jgi:DNA-binding MarR family transcriptional regulator